MSIYSLFSKRQKELRGEVPDVYSYDDIPYEFRVQVIHIWHDSLGDRSQYEERFVGAFRAYEMLTKTLCREYGLFLLDQSSQQYERDYFIEIANFLLKERNVERVIDAIELSFRFIDYYTRNSEYLHKQAASQQADAAIHELHARFKEHGLGYQYTDGDIIRVDSELLHAEAVKPALSLLRGKEFAGAQAEFLKAYEHFRHGNEKEALSECSKSVESTMKVICDKRGWAYDKNKDTSQKLIQICLDNGLIPAFWLQHFSALRSTLESGVPTGRNKLSSHGQGASPVTVPAHLTAYMLHMAASTIVFLVEAEKNMP